MRDETSSTLKTRSVGAGLRERFGGADATRSGADDASSVCAAATSSPPRPSRESAVGPNSRGLEYGDISR